MRLLPVLGFAIPALVIAAPTPRDSWAGDDLQTLNFALTLEQLENAFYQDRLAKYSEDDFSKAGLPEWAYGRWLQIRNHERVHVEFLTTAIQAARAKAVKPCKYRFPDYDPISFARTSSELETVGVSAYNDAFQYLQNKDYLTASGSIITVEARQASWISSAILKSSPWNTAFDIPLTPRQAYTVNLKFIESCPTENTALLPPGVTDAFPQLAVDGDLWPGQKVQVKFRGVETCGDKGYWATFKTGLGEPKARLEQGGWFVVPKGVEAKGTTYLYITSDDKPVSDENIVAGPTLVMFDFTSRYN